MVVCSRSPRDARNGLLLDVSPAYFMRIGWQYWTLGGVCSACDTAFPTLKLLRETRDWGGHARSSATLFGGLACLGQK